MLLLARLEGKPKSGAIFVYLFISATLVAGFYLALGWMLEGLEARRLEASEPLRFPASQPYSFLAQQSLSLQL